MLVVIGCLFVCVVALALYSRFSRTGRLLAKLPGINGRPWPVIGNILDLLLSPEELFLLLRRVYATHRGISYIGGLDIHYVNIYDPADIEKILSSPQYNSKINPYTFLKPWLGEGLLVSNGVKWQKRRKILTPAFHFNILKQFSRTFSERSEALVKELQKEEEKDATDIGPLIASSTLRIMCETSMGTSMHEGIESISKKYFKAIHFLGQSIVYRVSRILLHYNWTFNLTKMAERQKRALKDLHSFTDAVIQERKVYRQNIVDSGFESMREDEDVYTSGKQRMAMLDLLLESQKEGRIDDIGIREEVDTFMFEGHDTTAMALCYLLMSIANEQEVQDKIVCELSSIFVESGRPPSTEDLHQMKYLDCCIKESLRLYPSVPFYARQLNEDVVLSGYTIPAGCVINIHAFDVHRNPDIYPDPERFDPDRFLPQNCVVRHPYAYIPFSAGPRNCIGQKFAMLEMKTVVSCILRRYRLLPVTRPQDLVFITDLVLRTANPVYVKFQRRK